MVWSQEKIDNYLEANKILFKIKNETFKYIAIAKAGELEAHQFVLNKYKDYGLVTDDELCIVAYRQNTSFVHYFPGKISKKLKKNTLIMLDIWAKLNKKNAPYADITWMGYYGRTIPKNMQKSFRQVASARDKVVSLIRKKIKKGIMPTGRELDKVAREYIEKEIIGYNIPHTVGHSLGIKKDHGHYAGLSQKNSKALKLGLGYTIEPGIYYAKKFGIRSEVDFYIDKKKKLKISPKLQKNIEIIK